MAIVATTVIATFTANASASTILANNINNPNNTAIPGGTVTLNGALAQQFTTTSSAYILDAVGLYLQTNSVSTIDGTLSLEIWDTGTANVPANKLTTLVSNLGLGSFFVGGSDDTPKFIGVPTIAYTLSPSSNYWLVVNTNSRTTAQLSWSGYSNYSAPDVGIPANVSPWITGSWFGPIMPTNDFPRMEVTAVPEPSTAAMIGCGVVTAAVAAARYRRRR